jgi:hypothetical protein
MLSRERRMRIGPRKRKKTPNPTQVEEKIAGGQKTAGGYGEP